MLLTGAGTTRRRGRWGVIPASPIDTVGPSPPTAYDKTFTGMTLASPASLVVATPTLEEETVSMLAIAPDITSGVSFTLKPLDYLTTPVTTNVAFTIPLPFGVCTNVRQIRINIGGTEQASSIEPLLYWPEPAGVNVPREAYVRSALVRMNVTFPSDAGLTYSVGFDQPRTLEAGLDFALSTVRNTIDTSTFFDTEYDVAENIWEPNAVALFSAEWLCACLFKNRVRPIDTADAQWVDIEGPYQNAGYSYATNGGGTYAGDSEALSKVEWFAHSQVNDVRPHVTSANLITYEGVGNYAPWLYDRAQNLWLVYFRTGKLKWWRHAHRATQFYQNHISGTGYFDLRADDLKYSYGRSMLIDYLMTGDETLLTSIETVAQPSTSFNSTYTYVEYTGSESIATWTERNQAYAILAQLDAYEATGTTAYITKAKAIFDDTYDLQQNPATYKTGWVKDGGLPHTIMAHEGGTGGGSGNDPVTSPWMSAILLDAIMRYYLVTEDANALTFMADFGDYYANVCNYTATTGELNGYKVPRYLASDAGGGYTFTDAGDLADMEHVPDVLGGMAKCLWAKNVKGESIVALNAAFTELYGTITAPNWTTSDFDGVLGYWIRTGSATIADGKTLFRLAPPRKGSWWFNSAADLTYLEELVNG